MVSINKEEKLAILAKYPNVHVVRTMKQDSKRHHYFAEEYPPAMRLLREMRGIEPRRRRKKRAGGKPVAEEGRP